MQRGPPARHHYVFWFGTVPMHTPTHSSTTGLATHPPTPAPQALPPTPATVAADCAAADRLTTDARQTTPFPLPSQTGELLPGWPLPAN
eukprot:scaffold525_cov124-Isochrysis_galbana.AAC.3